LNATAIVQHHQALGRIMRRRRDQQSKSRGNDCPGYFARGSVMKTIIQILALLLAVISAAQSRAAPDAAKAQYPQLLVLCHTMFLG
jgi:hypothetical protein